MPKSISLVIPVFNGATTIKKTIREVKEYFSTASISGPVHLSEIILINDGSMDRTDEVIRGILQEEEKAGFSELKLRYFSNSFNCGKGYSIKRGVEEARGDIIIFTDTDLPYGCPVILEMALILASDRAEVAIGDRTLTKGAYEKYGRGRHLTSRIFSLITRNIVPEFPDTLCGLKGFTNRSAKKLFNKVSCRGFAFDVEMLAIAKANKIAVLRMPVIFQPVINPGAANKSMFSFRKRMRTARDLFVIWSKLRRGAYLIKNSNYV